jgi:hypothetical protein
VDVVKEAARIVPRPRQAVHDVLLEHVLDVVALPYPVDGAAVSAVVRAATATPIQIARFMR